MAAIATTGDAGGDDFGAFSTSPSLAAEQEVLPNTSLPAASPLSQLSALFKDSIQDIPIPSLSLADSCKPLFSLLDHPSLPDFVSNQLQAVSLAPPSNNDEPLFGGTASHGSAASCFCTPLSSQPLDSYVGVSTLRLQGVSASKTFTALIQRGLGLKRRLPETSIQASMPLVFDLEHTTDRLADLQPDELAQWQAALHSQVESLSAELITLLRVRDRAHHAVTVRRDLVGLLIPSTSPQSGHSPTPSVSASPVGHANLVLPYVARQTAGSLVCCETLVLLLRAHAAQQQTAGELLQSYLAHVVEGHS